MGPPTLPKAAAEANDLPLIEYRLQQTGLRVDIFNPVGGEGDWNGGAWDRGMSPVMCAPEGGALP